MSYLLVPVDNISWMKVLDGFEELVHHITFVDVLQQGSFLYHCMQISILQSRKQKAKSDDNTVYCTIAVYSNIYLWPECKSSSAILKIILNHDFGIELLISCSSVITHTMISTYRHPVNETPERNSGGLHWDAGVQLWIGLQKGGGQSVDSAVRQCS